MGWAFQTLNNEMLQVSEDIVKCEEMIQIEKDTIAEMEQSLKQHAFFYLKDETPNHMNSCDGCGKDDNGEIWAVRFIRESKAEIRRYKKIIKWKAEVLDTMKAQSKALRFVS